MKAFKFSRWIELNILLPEVKHTEHQKKEMLRVQHPLDEISKLAQICNNLHNKENNVFDPFDEQINVNMAVLKNYEPLETI